MESPACDQSDPCAPRKTRGSYWGSQNFKVCCFLKSSSSSTDITLNPVEMTKLNFSSDF